MSKRPVKNVAFGACADCGDDVLIDASPLDQCPVCAGGFGEDGEWECDCNLDEYQWFATEGDTAACVECGKRYVVDADGERGWLVAVGGN